MNDQINNTVIDRLTSDEILVAMNTVTLPRQEWEAMKRENAALERQIKRFQTTLDNVHAALHNRNKDTVE
jgi:hypothetical protein